MQVVVADQVLGPLQVSDNGTSPSSAPEQAGPPQDEKQEEKKSDDSSSDDGTDEDQSVDASLGLINTLPVHIEQQIDEPVTSGN